MSIKITRLIPPNHRLKRLKGVLRVPRSPRYESSRRSSEVSHERTSEVNYLESPRKSPSDKKDYWVIRLENGLRALLISDTPYVSLREAGEGDGEGDSSQMKRSPRTGQEERMAACALCVGAGSFSDPEEIPGLAHFLEHMVFMGSQKYPKENEFDSYIKKKGGYDNASTDCERTTYYFECHERHMRVGLDMFAQFFISPLMRREAMTRERETIESEFQMSLPSDAFRRLQLLCSTAHPDNPARKFIWGNLKTLKENVTDDYLYRSVHEFWKRQYSAHKMTLAIQARLPLRTLEEWVKEFFSEVLNNQRNPKPIDIPLSDLFQKNQFCQKFLVEPVKNFNTLEVSWVLPPIMHLYKSKPTSYMAWLLGHEGAGSLASFLRRRLWALDVYAGHGFNGMMLNSLYTLFSVGVNLTKNGYENVDEVIKSVFSYIKLLQTTGPEERLFKEIQNINNISFHFQEEMPASFNVEHLAECMQVFPPRDYITGSEILEEYKPDDIIKLFEYLHPRRANIMISSKKVNNKYNLDKTETWFNTRYTSVPLSEQLLSSLETIPVYSDFHPPEPNPFVPADLTLLPVNVPEPLKCPEKIFSNDLMDVYHKQDTKFRLPLGYIYCNLVTPVPLASARNAALQDLFTVILRQCFIEEAYPASAAHLDMVIGTTEKGLMVGVSGFNDKLPILLDKALYCITHFNHGGGENFKTMKNVLLEHYINMALRPGTLAKEIRMKLLLQNWWTSIEKHNALLKLNVQDFKEYCKNGYKNMFIQCLVQGNISKNQALNISSGILGKFKFKPLERIDYPWMRVYELPKGETTCRVNSFNPNDKNCVTTNYFQVGPSHISDYTRLELVQMLIEEPLFDTLRTREQLGYFVLPTIRDTFGILGFSVSIISQVDKHTVDYIESRITNFLHGFVEELEKLPKAEFDEVVESLMQLKEVGDIHMKEEVSRHWEEIKSGECVFDRIEREIATLKSVTQQDVIHFFRNLIGGTNESEYKKLTVQVVGGNDTVGTVHSLNITGGKLNFDVIQGYDKFEMPFIDDIYHFNRNLPLYPDNRYETSLISSIQPNQH